ncbi:MAG: 2-hydroxychromene-2-carboxylate isomerase [Myxococcota bacterium]|jgi:2-hydroxychromene-2-carboxylate isomerase
MPRIVEFFFDFMSPYSYLASTRVRAMGERVGATVRWRPFFLPGVMKATGNHGPTSIAAKAAYVFKDLQDWAKYLGLPPVVLPEAFPFLTVLADRVALVMDEKGRLEDFAVPTFRRIWAEGHDVSDPKTLEAILVGLGEVPGPILERAQSQELKDRLRGNTDEAVQRGAFGAPTFVVGDELFVGNDRLDFVERALAALPA